MTKPPSCRRAEPAEDIKVSGGPDLAGVYGVEPLVVEAEPGVGGKILRDDLGLLKDVIVSAGT